MVIISQNNTKTFPYHRINRSEQWYNWNILLAKPICHRYNTTHGEINITKLVSIHNNNKQVIMLLY